MRVHLPVLLCPTRSEYVKLIEYLKSKTLVIEVTLMALIPLGVTVLVYGIVALLNF